MIKKDLVIIGGGPAGLSSAISAYDNGVKDVLIIEREENVGGVLKQCIHNGFGLIRFGENLTGPEYAYKLYEEVKKRKIKILKNCFVTSITKEKQITFFSQSGIKTILAKAIILAMGCRERSKGAINVAGSRPAGIFSAGTAQKYVNVKGWLPGKKVVILGSGDIGLIMARRMTLEGAKVLCVVELMPYSSGLQRNIQQCLNDFNIPLYLSYTITEIDGEDRVIGVKIARVDGNRQVIDGTERYIECDTVLFSVGLIPENELTLKAGIKLNPITKGPNVDNYRETEIDGIFACGNVLHVHDLVDFVSEEAEIAGNSVAKYLLKGKSKRDYLFLEVGEDISYLLPQKIDKKVEDSQKIYFRVKNSYKNCTILLDTGNQILKFNKKAVSPSEMQTITLNKKIISTANKIKVMLLKGE